MGISFCLLHYPQDFLQLVKSSSLGASLGGKLCRIMVKPYLAGRSPSSGWAVSPPQGSQHSSTTNIDPCNGCLLGRSWVFTALEMARSNKIITLKIGPQL